MLTCVCSRHTTKHTIRHNFYQNYYDTAMQTHDVSTSQFDDRLIISYGKILTGLKKTPVSEP